MNNKLLEFIRIIVLMLSFGLWSMPIFLGTAENHICIFLIYTLFVFVFWFVCDDILRGFKK